MKLFRDAYPTITIFPRSSLKKWRELVHPDALKFLYEQTLHLLNLPNYPDDQQELLKKGEYLISHDQMFSL
jgi:hypothetical protein